jgi:hypothetical protein
LAQPSVRSRRRRPEQRLSGQSMEYRRAARRPGAPPAAAPVSSTDRRGPPSCAGPKPVEVSSTKRLAVGRRIEAVEGEVGEDRRQPAAPRQHRRAASAPAAARRRSRLPYASAVSTNAGRARRPQRQAPGNPACRAAGRYRQRQPHRVRHAGIAGGWSAVSSRQPPPSRSKRRQAASSASRSTRRAVRLRDVAGAANQRLIPALEDAGLVP